MRRLGFLLAVVHLAGCSDAYDPLLGPRNPRPGAEHFLATRSDISPSEKQCLIAITPCSAATLEKLANTPSREIRSLVAANPAVSPATLERLMNDQEPGVRQYVAANANTPSHVLTALSADRDENVRWQVIHRQDSPH